VLPAFTLQASTGDFALARPRRRTAMSLLDRVDMARSAPAFFIRDY